MNTKGPRRTKTPDALPGAGGNHSGDRARNHARDVAAAEAAADAGAGGARRRKRSGGARVTLREHLRGMFAARDQLAVYNAEFSVGTQDVADTVARVGFTLTFAIGKSTSKLAAAVANGKTSPAKIQAMTGAVAMLVQAAACTSKLLANATAASKVAFVQSVVSGPREIAVDLTGARGRRAETDEPPPSSPASDDPDAPAPPVH